MANQDKEQGAAQQGTVTGPQGQGQTQLRIDDAQTPTYYASTSRISGSGEEIVVDFAQGIRPGGQPNTATLKIDSRIIMSPWAAKRLALALSQTIQRYEQTYGVLEIDPRKRQRTQQGAADPGSTTSTG